jgi:short-subunit dehydrogenase
VEDLRGARIVVTGASRGIGVSVARALSSVGAHVVLVARSEDGLRAVADELVASGGDATVRPCDLLDPEARAALADDLSGADGWVHNAGFEHTVALVDHSADHVRRTIELNLHAPIDLARRAVPGLVARGGGALVFVSSMSGKGPTPYNTVYAATKYGVLGFAHSLRLELADTGVHVGVVCPGYVSGDGMWASKGLKAPAVLGETTPERVAEGVVAALQGACEVLVTPNPVRPLLALAQLFPGLDGWVMRRVGILASLKERARVTRRSSG